MDFYRISPALGHGGPANQTNQQNELFLLFAALQLPPKGASIYDVHTEGGVGLAKKEDVVREVA